jgi:hypothetical protein
MVARPGESLVSPFQCDFCWFINLTGRVFDARRVGDRINLAIIRRVNLDVFWSREASTVINSNRLFYRMTETAEQLGITTSMMMPRKVWPLKDSVGYGDTMVIL